MAKIKKTSNNLLAQITNYLMVKNEGTTLTDLMKSLSMRAEDAPSIADKIEELKSASDFVASRRDEHEKTDSEYVRLNVLKVSIIDRLLGIFQEEHSALKQRLDAFNRKVNGVKGLRFDIIQHRMYVSGCIPTGYEQNPGYGTEGNTKRILRKEPEASELATGLTALSQGEISEQYELSKVFSDGKKRREAVKKIFNDPEKLRFYAGYLKNDGAGLDFPVQGQHEPLMDLKTLKKLFVQLPFDSIERDRNIVYVDALLQQVSAEPAAPRVFVPHKNKLAPRNTNARSDQHKMSAIYELFSIPLSGCTIDSYEEILSPYFDDGYFNSFTSKDLQKGRKFALSYQNTVSDKYKPFFIRFAEKMEELITKQMPKESGVSHIDIVNQDLKLQKEQFEKEKVFFLQIIELLEQFKKIFEEKHFTKSPVEIGDAFAPEFSQVLAEVCNLDTCIMISADTIDKIPLENRKRKLFNLQFIFARSSNPEVQIKTGLERGWFWADVDEIINMLKEFSK